MAENVSNPVSKEETSTGVEPMAGEQGKGTTSDPFDHGNQEGGASNTEGGAPSSAVKGDETGDPSSAQQTEQKQQGADKPREEPESKGKDDYQSKLPHSDEEREKMMEKGDFPHDPNDHSGEPLKMHDGSEKKENKDTEGEGEGKESDDKTEGKKDRSASVAQEGGDPHGSGKGTGEQYVKSSGLAADGGDFDASNPGAGAEATRLLEEKGIHKSEGNKGAPEDLDTGNDSKAASKEDSGSKTSFVDKMKDKLHIGS